MLKIGKLDISWLEKGVAGFLAFGKKNKTSVMTGTSLALGWFGVYLFWQESKKAEEMIRKSEENLTHIARQEDPEAEEVKLPTKEKLLIYLSQCWPAALCGVSSSGFAIGAQKLNMDDIAKGYMAAQMFRSQNKEKDKEIERLKEELPEKKVKKIENELEQEQLNKYFDSNTAEETGRGRTLFIEKTSGMAWRDSIEHVKSALYDVRDDTREKRMRQLQKRLGDAFYVNDNPFPEDSNVYVAIGLDEVLKKLGCKRRNELGEIAEVRDYGHSDFLDPNIVMDYKDYIDPETGEPAVCYIRLRENEFLWPTFQMLEQSPL